jgi:hypothetical protein
MDASMRPHREIPACSGKFTWSRRERRADINDVEAPVSDQDADWFTVASAGLYLQQPDRYGQRITAKYE